MLSAKLLNFVVLSFALFISFAVAAGGKKARLGVGRNGDPLPDLYTATIDDLKDGLMAGAFTSADLVSAYLLRISEVNSTLRAVIETNPYALQDAAAADALIAQAQADSSIILPELTGIPILVKDNIATARPDQTYMNTTAGSYALVGSIPPGDSTVAANLKKAGAIILGKANLSQWANYRSSNSTNGWTARAGQTQGAYYPLQDPSGSSSGSGVSASIGLAAATLGSETSGSIISPSSRNSLCAVKPTVGLTSRYLVIPISETQDTVGPMARTCKDAAYLLKAIAGYDAHDAYTDAIPGKNHVLPDYVKKLKKNGGLQGVRIGIPRSSLSTAQTPEYVAFNATIAVLQSLGAIIMDSANFPNLTAYRQAQSGTVLGIDFVANIKTYFQSLTFNPTGVQNLPDLITYTEKDPREQYPDRNVNTWVADVAIPYDQDSSQYANAVALDVYAGSVATIYGALEQYGLDALLMPSSVSPGYAAIAGYPVVTVPLGYQPASTRATINSRGTLNTAGPHFPFGISFLGRRFSEDKLLTYAYAFEQATNYRKKVAPYILPSFQLQDVIQPNSTYVATKVAKVLSAQIMAPAANSTKGTKGRKPVAHRSFIPTFHS